MRQEKFQIKAEEGGGKNNNRKFQEETYMFNTT